MMTATEETQVMVTPGSAELERMEADLLEMEQIYCPLIHRFSPGAYLREIEMPAGSFIIGQQHKTDHFNIVLSGRAVVLIDGAIEEIAAPAIFRSEAGVRKVLYIKETMRWATLHVTHETDLQKLEEELIVKSDAFIQHQLKADIETLRLSIQD